MTIAVEGGSEPTIDAAPDGTLYVTGTTGLSIGGYPLSLGAVYRSDDGGATWVVTPSEARQASYGGGDIDLVVAPDGRIATTDLWLGNSSVAVSADKGQTWSALPLQGLPLQDRQWLAATSNAFYHVVHQIPAGHVVSMSLDGLLYPVHVVAATPLDQTGCICPPGNMVAESAGAAADRIAFVYATTTSAFGFARSLDGGFTWQNTYPGAAAVSAEESNFMPAFPVIASDGAGRLAVVWQFEHSPAIHLVTSDDFGESWSAPRVIEGQGTSIFPWVAYRNGKIAVSYYHTASAARISDEVPADAVWTLSYKDSSDNFGRRTDIEPVKTGPICTQGIACAADREFGDFQSLDIDPGGRAVIAYNRMLPSGGTELRFVRE